MEFAELRKRVCEANLEISRRGLAIQTWGNASEVDRDAGVFAIKPSGVAYAHLAPEDIVVLSLDTGEPVDGALRPSSDTPTHWHLYRFFSGIGGVVHTHSSRATAFAQAKRGIPVFGTTHCDYFYGEVPCTRDLTRQEVESAYELNTGKVIVEHFERYRLDPVQMPAVLVSRHAPFVWGPNAAQAVACGVTLEAVAGMALMSLSLDPDLTPVEPFLLDKHFLRKHGADAYYGQS